MTECSLVRTLLRLPRGFAIHEWLLLVVLHLHGYLLVKTGGDPVVQPLFHTNESSGRSSPFHSLGLPSKPDLPLPTPRWTRWPAHETSMDESASCQQNPSWGPARVSQPFQVLGISEISFGLSRLLVQTPVQSADANRQAEKGVGRPGATPTKMRKQVMTARC
ncbi:hypothetical protein NEUTE2DRAFT_134680 [Neurospora tetrasperma FGSC 2509]|nr:hypothetical protein NEUTE2DRAFT_134680 [Neurospora tetrasperma FGSC 2509]